MIPGIFIAAAVTTLLSLALIGGVLFLLSPSTERKRLALVVALQLPMCALAFFLVRLPVKQAIEMVVDPAAPAYVVASTLYAPLTEEPAKLWLLLLPWFRRMLTRQSAPRLGIATGLGFGIGEMWFIAGLVAQDPRIAALPWHELGGFINERLMVCFMHGVFTTTVLRAIPLGPVRGCLGFIGAVALHFFGNLPISLAAIDAGGLGRQKWQLVLVLWVQGFFAATAILFVGYVMSARGWSLMELARRMAGRARCPRCGAEFERSSAGSPCATAGALSAAMELREMSVVRQVVVDRDGQGTEAADRTG